MDAHDAVLKFWFEEIDQKQWWAVDPAFDAALRSRFLAVWQQAVSCELWAWRSAARGRLAEIIVLDQFSRNMFRGRPQAFAQDAQALCLAQEAVAAGVLAQLGQTERAFLLMPYMHSESRLIHAQAEGLFAQSAPGNHDFELRHKAIIDRFGRYPHRNQTLGRASTDEELAFLKQPGSAF